MRLTDEQIELYSRQIILREVGGTGQSALLGACVRVIGSGAAADICTSYLVGAGIGSVLVDAAASPPTATVLPLPPPGKRTPDAAITVIGRGSPEPAVADACDVLLDLGGAPPARSTDPERPLPRPRLGSILLRGNLDGRAHLLLLPRDTGCPACTHLRLASWGAADPSPGPIALASAGAIAALTCCRWILGLGDDRAARELVFADDDGPWKDGAGPQRVACPRGCPPPARPV